ncbi:RidA family protein [Pseudomonas mandelii]|uniref:RidA family protein n=1 Tax=Pseudomonas mandelii TaxID=75612 RepID=UPI00037C768B|nr:RidA family protein [Pseudomonas mandelii]
MIKAINAGAAWPGVSMSTLVSEGDLLFLSGHCPLDADGNIVQGDFEAQVRAVFENLKDSLEAAGVGFEALAKTTVYLANFDDTMLPTYRKVRAEYLNLDCPPASALVVVAALFDPAVLIEIEGIAVIPRKTSN